MIKLDIENPLGLCEGESTKSNELLQMYYRLGSDRSLDKLSQYPDCNLSTRQLARYSTEYSWQDRVREQHRIDSQEVQENLLELRLDALKRFGEVLLKALDSADVSESSLTQLASGLKAFADAYSVVFDALPMRRSRVEMLDLNKLTFADVLQEIEKGR